MLEIRHLITATLDDPATDTRQTFDLTDDELRQAADIIRNPCPAYLAMISYQGSLRLRSALGGYALDFADGLDKRADSRELELVDPSPSPGAAVTTRPRKPRAVDHVVPGANAGPCRPSREGSDPNGTYLRGGQ